MPQFLTNDIAGIVTTDATPKIFYSVPLPEHASVVFALQVIARRPSTADTKIWFQVYAVKRESDESASVLSTAGNIIDPIVDAGAAAWDVQFDLSGGSVRVLCIGDTGTPIKWFGRVFGLTSAD